MCSGITERSILFHIQFFFGSIVLYRHRLHAAYLTKELLMDLTFIKNWQPKRSAAGDVCHFNQEVQRHCWQKTRSCYSSLMWMWAFCLLSVCAQSHSVVCTNKFSHSHSLFSMPSAAESCRMKPQESNLQQIIFINPGLFPALKILANNTVPEIKSWASVQIENVLPWLISLLFLFSLIQPAKLCGLILRSQLIVLLKHKVTTAKGRRYVTML